LYKLCELISHKCVFLFQLSLIKPSKIKGCKHQAICYPLSKNASKIIFIRKHLFNITFLFFYFWMEKYFNWAFLSVLIDSYLKWICLSILNLLYVSFFQTLFLTFLWLKKVISSIHNLFYHQLNWKPWSIQFKLWLCVEKKI